MKILFVPTDNNGVGKFRSVDPAKMLHKMYGDKIHTEINVNPEYFNPEKMMKFDIIHIHRSPNEDLADGANIINMLKGWGIKVFLDIDDYWVPDSMNPFFKYSMEKQIPKYIQANIIAADHVTTTTEILAKEIRKYNKNVTVIPNAVDPNELQFQPKPIKSNRVRIGFLGGGTHLRDLQLLDGVANRFAADYQSKIQMVLVGFDTSGKIYKIENEKLLERAALPQEGVWYKYEQIFTDDGRLLKDEAQYKHYLNRYTMEEYDAVNDMPYRRIWTRDIANYARGYNHLDICVAPLVVNKFNMCKSQLKAIECGFMRKALVCQDFGAYQIDLVNIFDNNYTDGVNPNGNAALVDPKKNHKQWSQHLKRLVDEPDMRELMAQNLYETVMHKYNLRTVTKDRAELYMRLLDM